MEQLKFLVDSLKWVAAGFVLATIISVSVVFVLEMLVRLLELLGRGV